ncbi:MAG: zinc-ribbon domain-containing protein [Methanobacterium sp.]|nr:zinc-ribbon domain-containing protein [Methanobacterium sp.]
MKCPKCGAENPKSAEYCQECGRELKNNPNIIKNASIVAVIVFISCALLGCITSILYSLLNNSDIINAGIIGFGFGLFIGLPAAIGAYRYIYMYCVAKEQIIDKKDKKANKTVAIIILVVLIILVILFLLFT